MSIWDFFAWFFWFYIAVSCLMLYISVLFDVFRDDTLNGWGKAIWVLALIVLPFLGAIIYLIARGRSMSGRNAARARADSDESADYIRSVAATTSAPAEIESAKRLLDSGAITAEEFEVLKARALSSTA
ncbi:SHOCT domain-containing protein [Agromyces subbeticus]|uniref:SHOCT domain-containing protein n=1 Tax=Agromyces subbeticus TaxID=293890 RepID=UPI0003B351C7|nr:SHOCT domain-containing protein [Agromyces subbeticus]